MLHASCHCDAVRLEIDHAPDSLTDCNCSICRRYGTLWAYYAKRNVRVICEPGAVNAYTWGDRMIEFIHCTNCGCVTHYEDINNKGDDARLAVNARTMEPADIAHVRIRKFDGANTWKFLDE